MSPTINQTVTNCHFQQRPSCLTFYQTITPILSAFLINKQCKSTTRNTIIIKMTTLLSCITTLRRLGPTEYLRRKLKLPLIEFIYTTLNLYKTRTKRGVNNVRDVILKGTVIALLTAVLVWLSIFMYVAFYYVYVPTVSHERPVHLKFKPCCTRDPCSSSTKSVCSFPSAHVKLTRHQQLLMSGQSYKINLFLEMPESPTNKHLGMFMVCVDFVNKDGGVVDSSCRSAILHYRGWFLDHLYKVVFGGFFLFGSWEERQIVQVELFSDYEELQNDPVTDVLIEVQTRNIEVYSSSFTVVAQFNGLRYVMYHWPVVSAAIGITANLFFVCLVCLISWYQIINSDEYLEYVEVKKNRRITEVSDSESSVDFEDTSMLDDPIYEEKRKSSGNNAQENEENEEIVENVDS